jgi:hypothetical protein
MNILRQSKAITAALMLAAVHMHGQTERTPGASSATNAPPSVVEDIERKWSFSAAISTYIVPDSREYVQPTLTADYGWLHLEARYNYEDLETGSAWVGYNFSGGKKWMWEFTPMLGGVFGETDGIAPGYKGSLSWWKLELYSEAEFLFNSAGSDESFLYTWSELSLAPADWFRFGFVTQRTRAYKSDVDIQRGFLVGFSYKKIDLTTYVFNLDQSRPTIVVGASVNF